MLSGHLLIHAAAPTIPYSAVFIQDWHHEEGHVYWSSHPLAFPSVAGAGGGSLWNYPAMDYTPTQVGSWELVYFISRIYFTISLGHILLKMYS